MTATHTELWLRRNRPWLERIREALAPKRVEPLRVRVWLAAPVAWSEQHRISLDGPLQYLAVESATGRPPQDVFAGYVGPPPPIQLPLDEVDVEGWPITACSLPQMPPSAISSTRWARRRADVEQYGLTSRRVMTNGGEYKSLNLAVGTLSTHVLDWYVRGDREILSRMLEHLSHVGRRRSGGLGAVKRVELLDDPDDRSLVHQGAPQRALPVRDVAHAAAAYRLGTYVLRQAKTRAPYWHPASETLCAVPRSPS